MLSAPNVTELKRLDTSSLYDGQAVFVEGYYSPGDGGAKTVFYRKGSAAADDGGMIHDCAGGVFEVPGDTGEFAWYGIFNAEKDADNAFAAMWSNPRITTINARSALNFKKRHIVKRGQLLLDFHGNKVTTVGAEKADYDDPFAATFSFRGSITESAQTIVLTEPLQELNDIYEVADSSFFEVFGWYIVKCDRLAGNSEYQIDKLIQVTEIIDATHVRLGYKMGWPLLPGRSLTYTKCEPVVDITVRNLKFFATAGDICSGTNPLSFEYAVDTHIEHIYSQDNFWPLCIRRHNTIFTVKDCELVNPCEVVVGGTGYLAQNINCLFGSVRDCRVSNSRHLNDFTGSAYCQVENCHGDGDWCGTFVTHGQYEHDLSYVGNSGLLSFANSGPIWGGCAKRITVMRHTASRVVAYTKISDLTLIDVQVYKRKEKDDFRNEAFIHDTGTFFINCDGVQMRGCTAEGGITLSKRSSRSVRRNIFDGCTFKLREDRMKFEEEQPEIELVDFINCDFIGGSEKAFDCVKEKTFTNVRFLEDK